MSSLIQKQANDEHFKKKIKSHVPIFTNGNNRP